jgi:hypothetical protein
LHNRFLLSFAQHVYLQMGNRCIAGDGLMKLRCKMLP